MPEYWCRHFSLANGLDSGRSGDLPLLLRFALLTPIEVEQIKPKEILDLTVENEITADGPWWSVTVYWSPDRDDD